MSVPNADLLLQRITIDPQLCHGKPCIRGLRYPVEFLLELLASGMTHAEVLADYDDLEPEDLLAADFLYLLVCASNFDSDAQRVIP